MKRIFGLIPNVFFLGLVSLFNDFSAQMIIAVMPAFLVSLGATPIFIGFLEGFADALSSVLKIFSGWFSDRIRRRKIISVWGYSLSTFTRWILYFVGNIWQVFVLRAFDRVGKGFRDSPRDALLADSVARGEVGKSFGYQRAMDAAGGVIGPVAAVLILPLIGGNYRTLFLIAFGVGILALLSFFFVEERTPQRTEGAGEPLPFTFSPKRFGGHFKGFIASVFFFGLGAMPVSVMLLKSSSIGSIAIYIPLMYLVYNVSFAFFAIPFGKLSDKITERRVIIGGFAAAICSYLVLAFTESVAGITMGFVLFGVYTAMTEGVEKAFASKLLASEVMASGQGFLGAAIGISSLLAGLVGGTIWTFLGVTSAFVYGAAMMAIGLLIFIQLNGMRERAYNKTIQSL